MNGETSLICTSCKSSVRDDSEFCPYCGTIFIEDVKCTTHPEKEANGVCVICEAAFCKKCGKFYNSKFLCNSHCDYEIYENMARIYGSSDSLEIQYLKDILRKEGLHPFIYSRKASPLSLGGADYSLFGASGESDGHIINEIKLMTPFSEVSKAEEIIAGLNGEYSKS